jgi:Holliday junction resolvasome RuvABC endonuclease subunit
MTGIDLSLTATGLATLDGEGQIVTSTLFPGKLSGRARRDWIADRLFHFADSQFCIEGLAYSRNDPSAQERAALWYRVVDDFDREGCKVIVCGPTALKKFVTGSGKGEKEMMIREVYRRWKVEAKNNNEADAAGLLQVGRAVIGELTDLTTAQREVIAAIGKTRRAA